MPTPHHIIVSHIGAYHSSCMMAQAILMNTPDDLIVVDINDVRDERLNATLVEAPFIITAYDHYDGYTVLYEETTPSYIVAEISNNYKIPFLRRRYIKGTQTFY